MLCDACYHSEDNEEHKCDWCKEHGCFRKPIKPPYYRLTEQGKIVAEAFCNECVAYRKELLDGAKDTNNEEVPLPNVSDIEDDLNFFPLEIGENYCNGWGVTDNYDLPLNLDYGTDFILEG